jgi:malonyl-CoA O-methyltransferase
MNSVITVSPDKTVIKSNFSKAAGLYDRYADHHRIIARRLIDFVPPDAAAGSILEIGCGTGILTEKLLDRFPDSLVTALDISPDMVHRCSLKLRRSRRISFLVTDAETYCCNGDRYDLVVSSCSLQWFHNRQRFMESIYAMLPDGGSCLMAIPIRGMLRELEESCFFGARKVMRQLELDTKEKWINRFENSGMNIRLSTVENVSCAYSHPLEVLKSIRGIGACIEQSPSLLKPGDMKKMLKYYREHFQIENRGEVSSTYRVLYVLGRKL